MAFGEITGGVLAGGLPPPWPAAGKKDAGKKFGLTPSPAVSRAPSPKGSCGSVMNFDLIA